MSDTRHHRTNNGISWLALLIGVALGIGIGLYYTWEVDPVVEMNTAPWQLSSKAREQYVVTVALSYAQNQNVRLAFDRLRAASPDQDVWSLVADVACERVKTFPSDVDPNQYIRTIRALEQLYRPQGASGCADGMFPTPAPMVIELPTPTVTRTPTITPAASKTPSPPIPTNSPVQATLPSLTPPPSGGYILARQRSFCDPAVDGVIEIRVYNRLGQGVPGVPVTVTWGGGESDTFFTGLKPERGMEYADFVMEQGRTYTVSIPGLVSPAPSVEAEPCQAEDGETLTTSYYINFQQAE